MHCWYRLSPSATPRARLGRHVPIPQARSLPAHHCTRSATRASRHGALPPARLRDRPALHPPRTPGGPPVPHPVAVHRTQTLSAARDLLIRQSAGSIFAVIGLAIAQHIFYLIANYLFVR